MRRGYTGDDCTAKWCSPTTSERPQGDDDVDSNVDRDRNAGRADRRAGRSARPTPRHAARATAEVHGYALEHLQSNHEGALIDAIQAARGRCAAIVINAGAFTHYAWGIHDALASFEGPVVELHLSNPKAREPWRHLSVVAPVATGTIAGFGGDGYALAIGAVIRCLA